ncbi:MAG: hypothetical protein LQ342_008531 [Letrouitia transgressa]|nr:MAG: hypothetical protein LQ342_008531 [Letrouitia transgressa]
MLHAQELASFTYKIIELPRKPVMKRLILRRDSSSISPWRENSIHIKQSPFSRGWRPSELSQEAFQKDQPQRATGGVVENKEAFNWGYQADLDPTGGDGNYVELDGSPAASNLWPKEEDLPGFFAGIKKYYGQVQPSPLEPISESNRASDFIDIIEQALQLSRHLIRVFALSLGLPESYFDHLTTHPGGIARLLYYPSCEKSADEEGSRDQKFVGIRPHTDFECFTLLLQSQTSGLEILSPCSNWVSAELLEGTILINIGDFMSMAPFYLMSLPPPDALQSECE